MQRSMPCAGGPRLRSRRDTNLHVSKVGTNRASTLPSIRASQQSLHDASFLVAEIKGSACRRHVATSVASERMMGPSSRDSYSDDEEETPRRLRNAVRIRTPSTPPAPSQLPTPSTAISKDPTLDRAASTSSEATATATDALNIFSDSHVTWTPSLIAYAPFGTLLASFRMACWALGVLIDAPAFRNPAVISTYLKLLGFNAKWRNLELLPEGHHVMVSNHTTSADLMILFQLPQRYTHLITTAMPERVTSTSNLPVVLRPASPTVYDQLARDHAAATPSSPAPSVHVFPEGGLTNGNGCMQFSRGFSKFVMPGTPVVPVALRARTPWGIRTHTLTSSFLANLFWLSFCPWMEVEAVVLPPTTQGEGEGRGAFVQRIQDQIARELGVPVSPITIQQKRQLMKAAQARDRRRK